MIRAAIKREDLHIPAWNDFVASFGCELEFDEQTHIECYFFTDDFGQLSKHWIGTADRTFGLSISSGGAEIIRVYDENLRAVRLDEERQLFVITLRTSDDDQKIEFTV